MVVRGVWCFGAFECWDVVLRVANTLPHHEGCSVLRTPCDVVL
jgi:hypothetical protein